MKNIFEKHFFEKDLVCIYDDPNEPKSFYYGRIIGIDNTNVALWELSVYGDYDGLRVLPIDDIYLVEVDDEYNKSMICLMKRKKDAISRGIGDDSQDIVERVMTYAKESELIVYAELLDCDNSEIQGYVKKTEKDICMLNVVDNYGYETGATWFRMSDITYLECDSIRLQSIKLLNKKGEIHE